MSKGNTAESDFILKAFNATELSWSAITHLYVGLHTGDPGEGGSQNTSECAYGSYARVAVIRTSAGWTCSGSSATNTAAIEFPECTSGSETITHVSVGTATSGAGQIIYSGALNASRSVSSGIQPRFAASGLTITED